MGPRRRGPRRVAVYLDLDPDAIYLDVDPEPENVDPGCGYTRLPCLPTIRHAAADPELVRRLPQLLWLHEPAVLAADPGIL